MSRSCDWSSSDGAAGGVEDGDVDGLNLVLSGVAGGRLWGYGERVVT